MKKRKLKVLSEKDPRRLLRAVHSAGDDRDTVLAELLVGTGLRVGELFALLVGNLGLNDRSSKTN